MVTVFTPTIVLGFTSTLLQYNFYVLFSFIIFKESLTYQVYN